MIAVLFGTFNARHSANALLADDLRAAGCELRLCHEPLWEETRDKDAGYFGAASLARLGARWAGAAARLTRRFRALAADADVLVAGFNGQLDVLLLRRLAGARPIVFAPLVTITETLVEDRRRYAAGSPAGRLAVWLDRAGMRAADLVVLDTAAHRDWVAHRLGVDPARTLVHYLGADPAFAPGAEGATARPEGPSARLRVLFYGQYVPLHGADVIARAAALVGPGSGIEFDLVGTGPERASCDRLVDGLPHVRRTDWVPFEDLPARIRAADVVLGIFGRSEKARMVVPNKLYQSAQVGRPIVTADTPAIREVFEPGASIAAVDPEPRALADALVALAADPPRRAALGSAARAAVARVAAPDVRAKRLGDALAALVERRARGGASQASLAAARRAAASGRGSGERA
ncbi:MAG TPA: glycosyltransferase [Candidatus Binatia bacterium]|nr:glycosyltransferase [Candidatus Binatia bacterium]